MNPHQLLPAFDAFLAERSLTLEGVIVGGAALILLGVIDRPTRDCDVIAPPLSEAQREAIRAFARALRDQGELLDEDWINDAPKSLAAQLPAGWQTATQLVFDGRALRLRTLGRLDLLRSKVFALCDRGFDLADCVALKPTADELAVIRPWLEEQDGNPQWPTHVGRVLADLDERVREHLRGL